MAFSVGLLSKFKMTILDFSPAAKNFRPFIFYDKTTDTILVSSEVPNTTVLSIKIQNTEFKYLIIRGTVAHKQQKSSAHNDYTLAFKPMGRVIPSPK